jgi:hypothetical protein
MRFSRTGWGIVAGVAAVAAWFVVQSLEMRFLGAPNRASLWITFVGTGCAILWLADRYGLLTPPYGEPALGLQDARGTTPHPPRVTTLEEFLRATELDDLLRIRGNISSLTSEETVRVESVIHWWTDRQAVANLLFHPDLMPVSIRFEALDRALQSNDVPYFILAATVGLQQIAPQEIPLDKRTRWRQILLTSVRSALPTLANRASVVLYSWTRDVMATDILPELLSLYPVADEGACRNIVAALLARCGELSVDEFHSRLLAWRLSDSARTSFQSAYDEYENLKTSDAFRARLLTMPSFAYIPNLVESGV